MDLIGRCWGGGFENPAYNFKDKQPSNRKSQSTYIGTDFNSLDILSTSDGGRFFSSKKIHLTNSFMSADYEPNRQLTTIHHNNELEEFSQDLGFIMELIGTPQIDVKGIREEIFNKLGYDPKIIPNSFKHINSGELFESYVESDGKPISHINELVLDLHDQGLSNEEIGERLLGRKKGD
jgi:hypothetical protein